MTTFLRTLARRTSDGTKRLERGSFAIEQALFTSAGGVGCVMFSAELMAVIEDGMRTVLRVMP